MVMWKCNECREEGEEIIDGVNHSTDAKHSVSFGNHIGLKIKEE